MDEVDSICHCFRFILEELLDYIQSAFCDRRLVFQLVRKAPHPTVMAYIASGCAFVEQVRKPGLDASGVASVAGKPDVFAFRFVAFHLIDAVPGVHMLPRVIGQHRCFHGKQLCRNKERHIPVCHIVRDLRISGEVLIVDGKDILKPFCRVLVLSYCLEEPAYVLQG